MKFLKFFTKKETIIWISTFVISLVLLIIGSSYTKSKYIALTGEESALNAKVINISDRVDSSYDIDGKKVKSTEVYFDCELEDGNIISATQTIDDHSNTIKEVEVGDSIFVYKLDDTYFFGDYVRINKIIILCVIFCILLIAFGRMKGVNTLISLIFTCAAIFTFFLPSILAGFNIYISSIITCIYIIVMTLIFINGLSKKTVTTILGCVFGVITAGVIFLIMNQFLHLTGITCEEELYLQMLDVKIDLKAIIFAAIIVSSMGAVMDVSMDISSSLYEIKQHKKDITFKEMLKSGLNIGRDIMGTMSNTLILAFIGKSLTTTLLILTYSSSIGEVFNKELVIVEALEALIGSISILLTAPITSLVCSYLYTKELKLKTRNS